MTQPPLEPFVALGVGAAAAAWSPRVRRYLWSDEPPPPADQPASPASAPRPSDAPLGGERRDHR